MDIQQKKLISEESYAKFVAAIDAKYGSQACDLIPLHALLYYVSEEDIKTCLKARWCNDFMDLLQKKYRNSY